MLLAAAIGAEVAAAAAAAPAAATAAAGPSVAAPLHTELLRTGLYLVQGDNGNSLVRLSGQGAILVGARRAGEYAALRAELRRISRISDLPVKLVLIANASDDQAGGTARFRADGVPVLAQRDAVPLLPSPAADGSANPAKTAPVLAFDDARSLPLGGIEVRLLHVGSAHSAGDTVVQFPDMKIVAIGDLVVPEEAPSDGVDANGRLQDRHAALAELLALDFDTAVPAKGPTLTRADVERYRDAAAARLSGAK